MKRICPNSMQWNNIFTRLTEFAHSHPCTPPSPPKPLILTGWIYSNDIEKMYRWEETLEWATENGCAQFVTGFPDHGFYYVSEPTTQSIGPAGGPMYRPWDFDRKVRPSAENVERHFETLKLRWAEIVGPQLAQITHPLAFTGKRARRLLVQAKYSSLPPWGGWSYISSVESERRTFTRLRAAINNTISPHEIDHIDFTNDLNPIIPSDVSR